MAITINFNAETIVGNFCLGRIGEHNATELVITVPTALSGDPRTESYRVAFHTNGQTILSESYTESPITISLWRQLTLAPRLSLQVIAYDGAGEYVGKSVKLSGFYFEPSVMGDSVEADGSNPDLAHEILDIMAKNAEQDARLNADEGNITALQSGKVDKVAGKGLSTEDYTTAEKEKLATLQNYVLPTASTSTLGGVKVDGETITITNGVIKATVQAGDYVRILTVTNGVANYGAGWLKQFHEEGKIVVYDECILEYSTETTNTIVYYYFDVKNSKQKKLTVTNSKDASIFEVQTYASNNQGISGTIKTLNEWLSQFNTDIGTLQVDLSTVQTSLANKQEKFVEVTFTPTNSADWTQGGTFDKTFSEMAAAVSNGNLLTLKVDGSANFHALQVGGGSSSTYWWFVWYTGAFYSIALHHTLPDDEVQVYKYKYASDSVTIDNTTKTVAEWITQLEGYNTITIGQQTHTVEWWINNLYTNKSPDNIRIELLGETKTVGGWLTQILDNATYDSFNDVAIALSTLSSQIVNKIDEPSSEGTNGQVLTTDGNGGRSWTTVSGASRLPDAYQEVEYIESTGTQYIDTNYNPCYLTKVKVDFTMRDNTNFDYPRLFGNFTGGGFAYSISLKDSNNDIGLFITAGTMVARESIQVNSRYQFEVNLNSNSSGTAQGYLMINGDKTSYVNTSEGSTPIPAYIFAANFSGTGVNRFGCAKLHAMQIYERVYNRGKADGFALIKDYVPCYRKNDGVIGLYDMVNQDFLTNQGTGTFLKGNDVN